MHDIKLTPKLRQVLAQRHILPKFDSGSNALDRIERLVFDDNLHVSDWTQHVVRDGKVMVIGSLGYMSYAHSPAHRFSTGAFCSLGANVRMMRANHPYERVSTHPISYGPVYAQMARDLGVKNPKINKHYNGMPAPTRVGHDVWIAADVILAGGLTIGTGAVIGSGAIVTKDVSPYAIVVGVPGKVIKYRFPPDLIQRLLETRWWEYSIDVLADFSFENPSEFCDLFEKKRQSLDKRATGFLNSEEILKNQ